MTLRFPTPGEQLAFLSQVERLLAEGQFTATYKYALLVALADLAIEHGRDDGSELELPVQALGEKFIDLYWRQALPFAGGIADGAGRLLIQNKGRQAEVISSLALLQSRHGTLAAARRSRDWSREVARTTRLVCRMPLGRLQRVGLQRHEFLYTINARGDAIRLKAGVAANLRRFHGLVLRLAQSEWLRFVQENNEQLLGGGSDLASFLFGANRRGLARLRDGLRDLQRGRCFYCGRALPDSGAVDHFIAWSRYPRDLTHNLVLAHGSCNTAKRDLIAAETHLERWIERAEVGSHELLQIGETAGFLTDWTTSRRVAEWSYAQAESVEAQVWIERDSLGRLDGRWRRLLA